jgi:hypothetical protein
LPGVIVGHAKRGGPAARSVAPPVS